MKQIFFTLFESIRNAEVLILDDFGQQNLSDWALEKLYQLISYRHDRFLRTVITSQYIMWEGADNHDWNRLQDRYQWESILSRLKDTDVVTARVMGGPDFRERGHHTSRQV